MKDVYGVYAKCATMLKDLGIQSGNINGIIINSRAKSRWGKCRKKGDSYIIEISDMLLDDYVDDKSTETTMLHELLHTCKNCMNHGTEWKRLANKVNTAYGYNIKRCASADEKGVIKPEVKRNHKIVCTQCGYIVYRQRESKLTKHPEYYRCGVCNGYLVKEY